MVHDAEAHKAEDEARKALVEVKNQADALIHQTRKSLTDLGENFDASEKASIEKSIEELETLLKDDSASKEQIDAKVKELTEKSHKLAEAVYAKEQGGQQAEFSQCAKSAEVKRDMRQGAFDGAADRCEVAEGVVVIRQIWQEDRQKRQSDCQTRA